MIPRKMELLESIFSEPVDGANYNAYDPIVIGLERLKKLGIGRQQISINQLLVITKKQRNRWKKEIKKYIKSN